MSISEDVRSWYLPICEAFIPSDLRDPRKALSLSNAISELEREHKRGAEEEKKSDDEFDAGKELVRKTFIRSEKAKAEAEDAAKSMRTIIQNRKELSTPPQVLSGYLQWAIYTLKAVSRSKQAFKKMMVQEVSSEVVRHWKREEWFSSVKGISVYAFESMQVINLVPDPSAEGGYKRLKLVVKVPMTASFVDKSKELRSFSILATVSLNAAISPAKETSLKKLLDPTNPISIIKIESKGELGGVMRALTRQ